MTLRERLQRDIDQWLSKVRPQPTVSADEIYGYQLMGNPGCGGDWFREQYMGNFELEQQVLTIVRIPRGSRVSISYRTRKQDPYDQPTLEHLPFGRDVLQFAIDNTIMDLRITVKTPERPVWQAIIYERGHRIYQPDTIEIMQKELWQRPMLADARWV